MKERKRKEEEEEEEIFKYKGITNMQGIWM